MVRSFGVCFLLLFAVPSHAQTNWDAYQPTRIDTVLADYKSVIEKNRDSRPNSSEFEMWAATKYSRIRVRAIYTGRQRSVNTDTKRLISTWLKARGVDSTYVDLFKTEVQFETSSGEYWFPMQSKPLSYLIREVSKGDEIDLYITFMGAYTSSSDPLSWVFCVNEFQTRTE